MAIPERKVLFPKVKPSVPVRRIRQAVRKVAEEMRKGAEMGAQQGSPELARGKRAPADQRFD